MFQQETALVCKRSERRPYGQDAECLPPLARESPSIAELFRPIDEAAFSDVGTCPVVWQPAAIKAVTLNRIHG
jgi:hypothetical protein